MSRRIRRDLHKRIGASGYEQIAGDLEVRGKILGPSINDIMATIDKIVSGTTTPVKLTITKCEGMYKAIRLQWVGQYNLMNFDHYEVQVSEDNTNWYSLKSDGINWGDVLNGDTDTRDGQIIHAAIPFLGTAQAPIGRKLYYRMRQKTILGAVSAWSDVVSATTSTVESGDIAADTIYGNQMRVGEIKAREIAFADDVYGNAHENPDGAELFDLAQPDCLSSIGRIPSVRNTVFAPGEIEDELGNKYLGPHAPKFTGQSGAIFAARTNLVTDPENLTTANWTDYGAATELLSEYFAPGGQRYTKITAGAANNGKYQTVTFTGDGSKSIQTWIRRGSETSTTVIGIYDNTAPVWRGYITINWATKVVTINGGTLLNTKWNGDDEVWVSGVISSIVAANVNRLIVYTATNGAYVYFTALQAENAAWPSPYIDRTRWITQTRPAVSPNYAVTMPGKFLFKIEIEPWFAYTTGTSQRFAEFMVDATHRLIIYWHVAEDKISVYWEDGGTGRNLYSSLFTTNINQKLTLFGALNLDSGGINDSRLVVFLEDGTKFSEDTSWSGAPDVKASTFLTLSVGHSAASAQADSIISYVKLWTWDGAALGTINTEADVDAIVQDKTSLFDLELEPYETAYQPISKQGAIGVFPATTNLVASPEDLTTASWVNEAGTADALSDYYIEGKRFTMITSGAGATGVYQDLPLYTGATTKGFSCWMRKGTAANAYIVLYDTIAAASRLIITVTWSTKSVVASAGTLRDAIWISNDLVWISGVSTSVTVANLHRLYCRPTQAASTVYFTAVMTENSAWPTPYTPTKRTAGQLTYKLPGGLPDRLSVICTFRPWFSYDTAFSVHVVWSVYIDGTHRLNCYYDSTTDMFTISWIDGGAGRFLFSQQFGGAFDVLNQWITLAASIDLSVGGITTGSFFKVYATSIAKDSSWSGNIDSKTSNFNTFHIGYQTAALEAQGFISDLMFLPGVLLTEEQCDRHYNMTRPWYSPTETAAGDRSVRIDKSGIRMHNAGLTISDNRNRLIDISNRTGLLAKDAAGVIIHDIPDAPILTDMIYGGHVMWKGTPNFLNSISMSYTDVQTDRNLASAISNINISAYVGNCTNIKGAIVLIRNEIYLASAKVQIATEATLGSYYCHFYNDSAGAGFQRMATHHKRSMVATQVFSTKGEAQAVIPVVYDAGIPYVSWYTYSWWETMTANNAAYYTIAYLFLQGFLI